MGLLYLRLLAHLIEEKGFLPDLDIVAEEECDGDLKEDEEISSHSNLLFFHPERSDAERGVAEDENINGIFIHKEVPVPFFEVSPLYCTVSDQGPPQAGVEWPLPVKIES